MNKIKTLNNVRRNLHKLTKKFEDLPVRDIRSGIVVKQDGGIIFFMSWLQEIAKFHIGLVGVSYEEQCLWCQVDSDESKISLEKNLTELERIARATIHNYRDQVEREKKISFDERLKEHNETWEKIHEREREKENE